MRHYMAMRYQARTLIGVMGKKRKTPRYWQHRHWRACLLWPFSWLFAALAVLRREAYRVGLLSTWRAPVPVAIVGNITAGGSGKTPLVIALTKYLTGRGLSIGLITRGYGGQSSQWPVSVVSASDAVLYGDEAVLMARHTGAPVVAGADRVAGIKMLLSEHHCDLILCDDGLQHYRLQRDIEIAVYADTQPFGNGWRLPAGPLREPVCRLQTVSLSVCSGAARQTPGYELKIDSKLYPVCGSGPPKLIDDFLLAPVNAVAGIAHPVRFFNTLRDRGLQIIAHEFPDHYPYQAADFSFPTVGAIVMTEKDAVKCRELAIANAWYLPVSAQVDEDVLHKFEQLVSSCLIHKLAHTA